MRKKVQEKRKPGTHSLAWLLLGYMQHKIQPIDFIAYINNDKIKGDLNQPVRLDHSKQAKTFFPLEWALIEEDSDLLEILLKAGANPDSGIVPPLMRAIINLDATQDPIKIFHAIRSLELLKQYGVKIDFTLQMDLLIVPNSRGNGIGHFLAMFNCTPKSFVKILEIFPDIKLNTGNPSGKTPLQIAISNNNLPLVQCLYDYGVSLAPVKYKKEIFIPFQLAIEKGNLALVQFILQKMVEKPFPNMENILQQTLETHFFTWKREIIELMLQTNVINLNHGYPKPVSKKFALEEVITLMHLACQRGEIGIVHLFIKHKGMINSSQGSHRPFLYAVMFGQVELVDWLLDSKLLDKISLDNGLTMCGVLKNREVIREKIVSKYFNTTFEAMPANDGPRQDEANEQLTRILKAAIIENNPHEVAKFSAKMQIDETPMVHHYLHFAIQKNAHHWVKYFLTICNPFVELENISAIFQTILEKNQPIMELLIHHYRALGKMEVLKNHLSVCESRLGKWQDAEQYRLFLKQIHTYYFQEIKPVTFDFFESASAHHYLAEQGIKLESPVIPTLSDSKHTLFKPAIQPAEPTWLGGQRVDLKELRPVEGLSGHDAFVWLLDAAAYQADGCMEKQFKKFEETRCSVSAGSKNIKTLKKLNYVLPCNINGHEVTLSSTREFRIQGFPERILLFPLLSDCKRFTIYIGGKFCEDGLHDHKDTARLMESNRHGTKMVEVTLPMIGETLSLGECP